MAQRAALGLILGRPPQVVAGKLSLLGEVCRKVSSGTSDLSFQRGSQTSTALGWTTGMAVLARAMGLRVRRLLRGVPG